jgi:hypothetical protein
METVMQQAQMKYVLVDPEELATLPIHGQQVLMVNCTGQMGPAARERVRRFVTAGGLLYTTDHTVHYLLEKIFPGYIKWNGRTSDEGVFPMVVAGDRGLLQEIGSSTAPRWQLAGGGFPIEVVDRHKVEVLMSSKEVGARYGAPVLGVRFRVGDGQVVHVTGHFYTQPGQVPSAGQAQANAFEQMSANVVAEKRSDNDRIAGLYRRAPRRQVVLQSEPRPDAPAAQAVSATRGGAPASPVVAGPSSRVRVLEERGKYSRVRDTEGNEGWVKSDEL